MVYLYLLFMTPRLTILPLFLSHTLFLFVFIITKFSQINPACCFLSRLHSELESCQEGVRAEVEDGGHFSGHTEAAVAAQLRTVT